MKRVIITLLLSAFAAQPFYSYCNNTRNSIQQNSSTEEASRTEETDQKPQRTLKPIEMLILAAGIPLGILYMLWLLNGGSFPQQKEKKKQEETDQNKPAEEPKDANSSIENN